MSDQRFEKFINLALQNDISAFHESVEHKLVKEGRENKFVTYVKAYGLAPSTQCLLLSENMKDWLRLFIFNDGVLSNDVENALKFIDKFKSINKVYQEAKKEYQSKMKTSV